MFYLSHQRVKGWTAMSKGWLVQGLQEAKKVSEKRPELRERVIAQPSGYFLGSSSASIKKDVAVGPSAKKKVSSR